MSDKRKNGEGTVRKVSNGVYEAICQSSIINPMTMKYKRFKRRGATAEGALSAAKMAMKAWEKEIQAGKNTKLDKKKIFSSYVYEYLDIVRKPNVSGSTYYTYANNIKNNIENVFIGNYQLSMLNKEVFLNYYNFMLERKSINTLETSFRLCKDCCKWLVDRSLLEENYADHAYEYIQKNKKDEFHHEEADKTKVKKIYSTEDIMKVYQAWQDRDSLQAIPIFLFLLETGMRAQEFASLRLNCIDLDKREIYIREASGRRYKNNDRESGVVEQYDKVTKTGEERTIKISDLSYELILHMMKQTKKLCVNNNPENLLYPTFRTGKKRTNNTMEACMKLMCEKLGIDRGLQQTTSNGKTYNRGLSLHALRHTYSSLVRQNNQNNIIAIAMSTGHKNMSMEDHYTHQTTESVQSIVSPMESLLDNSSQESEKALKTSPTKSQGEINNNMTDTDKELYEMYLRLKEKFE